MFLRVLAVLVSEFLVSACMLAQAVPNAPVTASSEEISQWLQGGDQRLVAWGAYFAAQQHDLVAVRQLDLKIESWQPLPAQEYDAHGDYVPRSQEQRERSEVMAQVLDAQIQLNGTVSSQAVEQLGNDFPAQALILFARLVYKTRRGAAAVYDWRALAHDEMVHMAAAILAQHPPDGFTASLLNETSIVLNISVTDEPQQVPDIGGSGVCGDSVPTAPMPGWPQPWTYVVEQHWSNEHLEGMTVLVPGDPAITARRALTNSSCSRLDWFSSAVRLRLAKQEAGASSGSLSGGILYAANLPYPGPKAYSSALFALVDQRRENFRPLLVRLQQLGYLSEEEVQLAGPVFHVRVRDERRDKTPPLPNLRPTTPKIVFDDGDAARGQAPWLNPF